MLRKQTAVFFVIFLAVLPFFAFAGSVSDFSEMENRVLQQWPRLNRDTLLSGTFMREMTDYVQDQFWQRSWWIQVKNGSERLQGRKDIGNAYLGPDGCYAEKRAPVDDTLLDRNLQTLQNFCAWSAEQGVSNWFLGVPSSATVYPERLPLYAPVSDEKQIAERVWQAEPNYQFVDPFADLMKDREHNLYFYTDHHWTARGAYAAYRSLMAAMEMKAQEEDHFSSGRIDGFYGTLYSRAPLFNTRSDYVEHFIDPTVSVEMRYSALAESSDSLLVWENAAKKDKYTLFLGGVQPQVRIKTSTNNGRRLLILKDSFAHPLVPFLASHFEEIYLLDLRYFRNSVQDYLLENKITDLLFVYNLSWFAADTHFEALNPD